MTDQSDNQLIADLARDIIAQTAPQELPLFRAHSEAYFKNPAKALANIKPMEDMLGFGLGEVVTFMTPIALAVVTQVLKYLAEQVVKTVKDEGGGLASDAVKRLIKRFRPAEQGGQKTPPPLSPEQMAHIRRISFERARQLNLSEDQSALLADAVVGGLAITSS